MTADLSPILDGISAWLKGKPYHTVLTLPPVVHHVYKDCDVGLQIELRHLRKGKAGRRLCEVCAGRQATT
jgi:hypothetical protein